RRLQRLARSFAADSGGPGRQDPGLTRGRRSETLADATGTAASNQPGRCTDRIAGTVDRQRVLHPLHPGASSGLSADELADRSKNVGLRQTQRSGVGEGKDASEETAVEG